MRCSMARDDGSLWYSLQFMNIAETSEDVWKPLLPCLIIYDRERSSITLPNRHRLILSHFRLWIAPCVTKGRFLLICSQTTTFSFHNLVRYTWVQFSSSFHTSFIILQIYRTYVYVSEILIYSKDFLIVGFITTKEKKKKWRTFIRVTSSIIFDSNNSTWSNSYKRQWNFDSLVR